MLSDMPQMISPGQAFYKTVSNAAFYSIVRMIPSPQCRPQLVALSNPAAATLLPILNGRFYILHGLVFCEWTCQYTTTEHESSLDVGSLAA